jgi:hypothetical protein
MIEVQTIEELIELLSNMNKENSVCQFFLPGKGIFTIVLQEQDERYSASSKAQLVTNETENKGRVQSVSELERNPFL